MKRYIFIISIILLANASKLQAQESIMNDISYRYLDTLIYMSKTYYARTKIFEAQIGNAELNVKRAKSSWLDMVNFSYLYSPRNTTTIVNPSLLNGPQFGVGINIGTLFSKPTQIKIAKNDLQVAWLQKDEYLGALEANVKERYFRFVQQLAMLKLLSQSELDAKGIMQSIKNKFEKGEETFENYSKSTISYTNQNQQKIAAEADLLIAKARLEELIGVKLEDIK